MTDVKGSSPQPTGLRGLASCGGCAAKVEKPFLETLLPSIARKMPELLLGLNPPDDATVFRVSDDLAVVSTVDFFPPLVDDPTDYGAIAAANACSDIYAVGGTPAFGLAVSGFPRDLSPEVMSTVISAAAGWLDAHGAVLAGGHTIHCVEPVFGVAVTGFVHPNRIWRAGAAAAGHTLVLSKALGTGILLNSEEPGNLRTAVASMKRSNGPAADALRRASRPPSAVTDVTGFGLLAQALEMGQQSQARLKIAAGSLPLLGGARDAARRGIRTSADAANRRRVGAGIRVAAGVPAELVTLAVDPQTSGGLLAAVPPTTVQRLSQAGFVAIGEVVAGQTGVDLY